MNRKRMAALMTSVAGSNGRTIIDIGTDGKETAANADSGIISQYSVLKSQNSGELSAPHVEPNDYF